MQNRMPPVHPGEMLREELTELNLSARGLTHRLDLPANRITAILNEKRSITPDTALRLAQYFGTSPEFWLNLQQTYDLKIIRQTKEAEIKATVQPLMELDHIGRRDLPDQLGCASGKDPENRGVNLRALHGW